MRYFIEKVLIRNFKRIPYFFETEPKFFIENQNYALMGKLSASLLHDILTPLCSLSLATDIKDSKSTQLFKPLIQDSTSQIQEYVQLMKNFMIDAPQESQVHINTEILKCIKLLRYKALENQVQIQFIEFDQVFVSIHPLHIYQIIINLLSNAIEASTASETKKVILIIKKDRQNFYLDCKDFGSGMTEATLERLGTCNFSTKSDTRGFGLYSVKHIVTNILNGQLDIKSEPDDGSLFSCTIPLLK